MGKVTAALTPKGKEFRKVCRRCASGTLTKRGAITPLVYEFGRANCLPGRRPMTGGISAAAVAAYIWIAEGGLRICLDTFGYLLYETQHSLLL